MDKNFNRARVPDFFTPIIIACGRLVEFVTSDEDTIVDIKQIIVITKIIPLRQLKKTRQHLTDIRITRSLTSSQLIDLRQDTMITYIHCDLLFFFLRSGRKEEGREKEKRRCSLSLSYARARSFRASQ